MKKRIDVYMETYGNQLGENEVYVMRELCVQEIDIPIFDNNTVVRPESGGIATGCNGITCVECWNKEYDESDLV